MVMLIGKQMGDKFDGAHDEETINMLDVDLLECSNCKSNMAGPDWSWMRHYKFEYLDENRVELQFDSNLESN
jgi:hypothetical protein